MPFVSYHVPLTSTSLVSRYNGFLHIYDYFCCTSIVWYWSSLGLGFRGFGCATEVQPWLVMIVYTVLGNHDVGLQRFPWQYLHGSVVLFLLLSYKQFVTICYSSDAFAYISAFAYIWLFYSAQNPSYPPISANVHDIESTIFCTQYCFELDETKMLTPIYVYIYTYVTN